MVDIRVLLSKSHQQSIVAQPQGNDGVETVVVAGGLVIVVPLTRTTALRKTVRTRTNLAIGAGRVQKNLGRPLF